MNPFVPDFTTLQRHERRRVITLAAVAFAASAVTVCAFMATIITCGGAS